MVVGLVWLIFHRKIALYWARRDAQRMPRGAIYFVRYVLGPILVIAAGVLLISGVMPLK